jgi:probable F420-dependent oxidoreductase
MRLGVAMFVTDETIQPVELGRMVEERGLDSLFLPEHTHIPTSRETPHPSGGPLPREHSRTVDPFVALSAVAATTTAITIGTGVCLLAQRDPIVTAKAAATLDCISGGRFVLGVGAGWILEEAADHGIDPKRRFSILREKVQAVRAIWTEDEASYAGDHVDLPDMWSWPKPVTKPHPPVYVGASGPTALDRVLSYGDGWMPMTTTFDDNTLIDQVNELQRRAWTECGRNHVPVLLMSPPRSFQSMRRFAVAGVEQVAVWLPSAGGRDAVERALDELAQMATQLRAA